MPSELTQLRDQIVALEREINANMHRKFPQSASPALPSLVRSLRDSIRLLRWLRRSHSS